MIIGIGTDLIEIQRIEQALTRFGKRFEERVFTAYEQSYARECATPTARYAKRFAAKEAVFKALGTNAQQGIHWHDAEIRNTPSGQPFIHASQKIIDLLRAKHGEHPIRFHLSLTDTASLAQAFVIIHKE